MPMITYCSIAPPGLGDLMRRAKMIRRDVKSRADKSFRLTIARVIGEAVFRSGSDLIASFMKRLVKEFYTGIANLNVSTGTQPNFG
jgi:hypothetical protein